VFLDRYPAVSSRYVLQLRRGHDLKLRAVFLSFARRVLFNENDRRRFLQCRKPVGKSSNDNIYLSMHSYLKCIFQPNESINRRRTAPCDMQESVSSTQADPEVDGKLGVAASHLLVAQIPQRTRKCEAGEDW